MNPAISRKTFLRNNALALGGISLGLPAAWDFHKDQKGDREQGSAIRRGSWVQTGKQQNGDIPLTQKGRECRIVVDSEENAAVHQAAAFLSADIKKISGYQPPVVNSAEEPFVLIHLVTLSGKQLPAGISTEELKGKWESFKVITAGNNEVWLIGSDFRGTAFAAYTLSERLGIDPLYQWTGYQPVIYEDLLLKQTRYYSPSPVIKYRGFFHDDEDILPRPFDENDYPYRFGNIALEWYQKYFETALRLRMNVVAPYTRVRRRLEVQQCASQWGLFYTSHHYDILLSNPFGIERFDLAEKRGVTPDWDWFNNKENMIRYWQAGVEENKSLSAIWPVGLRGTDDHAYAFPDGVTSLEQATIFGEVLERQVALVRESLPPGQFPLFHFTLYTEMLEKYEKNREAFKVPEEVMIIWPDDNDGLMRNLPADKGKWKHGIYYHLSYFGGNSSKQSIHTVSPGRIAQQFQRILQAGATEFLLVNVSEMREFIMEARMIAEIGTGELSLEDNEKAAEDYMAWWSREYFGIKASKKVSAIYSHYYELMATPVLSRFGPEMFEKVLEQVFNKYNHIPCKTPAKKELELLERRNEKYKILLDLLAAVRPVLNDQQQQFLFEQVELPVLSDNLPARCALLLEGALQETEPDMIMEVAKKAIHLLEQLEIAVLRAERPPFEKWYRPTWIRSAVSPLNWHRSYQQLRLFITSGGKAAPVKPVVKRGHRIPEAKAWSRFLDEMEFLP